VFGLFRPTILWPRWLDEAPAATQAAAIAHEKQHLAVRDPLVLALGLFLGVLAPWNPALWWQLQRMRFAMEADCDQRVVRSGTDENSYARALLQIAQARAAGGAALAMLMSAPSWLERRVRILLASPGRRTALLAAAGLPFALGALVAVAQLPAPSLRGTELRKLPPEDTTPGAEWARAIARSRYPELFDRHIEGTAVVAAIFLRDGTLKLVHKQERAPGVAPRPWDFSMVWENQRAGVDLDDRLYWGAETELESTIGPWLETVNPGRVFVVYEVLKWEPDPSRSSGQAESALRDAEPQLPAEPIGRQQRMQLTLFMNEDGTIGKMSKRIVPEEAAWLGPDAAAERFAAMGIPKERLGRGFAWIGFANAAIVAAWPRRPDDPPDIWDLSFGKPALEIFREHPPRVDAADEEDIGRRYFHDLQMHGAAAVTEVVDGQTTLRIPWVLLGTDGRVWDAGLWHSNSEQPVIVHSALFDEIRARYPGVVFQYAWSLNPPWYISGVPVVTVWISATSPIQKKSDVDLQKAKGLLVTGGLAGCLVSQAERFWGNSPPSQGVCESQHYLSPELKGVRRPAWVPFAAATELGVPARFDLRGDQAMAFDARGVNSAAQHILQNVSLGSLSGAATPFEVTATQAGQERVTLHVRSLPPDATANPASPPQIVEVEALYGQATPVELPGDTPDQKARLLLRVERLKQ